MARYGRRFATVEPVFGNVRHNKRLDRFTLRGRRKVNSQWQLYCLVHNIEKLALRGQIPCRHGSNRTHYRCRIYDCMRYPTARTIDQLPCFLGESIYDGLGFIARTCTKVWNWQ